MGAIYSCIASAAGLFRGAGSEPLHTLGEDSGQPVFSWDKRDASDMTKFIVEEADGEQVNRWPGDIRGKLILLAFFFFTQFHI